jgi:hypothetical protein
MKPQLRNLAFLYRSIYWILAISAAVSVVWMPPKAYGEIKWRSGPVVIPKLDREELAQRIAELAGRPEQRHVVIQTDQSIGSGKREQLRDAGLNVLRYVGNQAFFASFSSNVVNPRALSAIPFLAGIKPIEREWKLHTGILAGRVPSWAAVGKDASGAEIVAVYVLFHPDVILFTEAIDAVRGHGAVIRDTLESINGLVIELPLANINLLADEDSVQWIEWPLPRMSAINDSNREITEANLVQQSGLDGLGVKVLVYDAGTARETHVDFGGRLTVHDSSGMHYHATHVAGTIGGDGSASDGLYKGMAPRVTMLSYGFEYDGSGIFLYSNPGDIESDYYEAISIYGAHISNNSIGTNTESNGFDCALQGDYGVTSQLIDTIVRGDGSNGFFAEPFRIVWANGNERQGSRCDVEGYGDYYSTAPPAGAKNHITVGALNSNNDTMTTFSSWGPVDDGRMKPDISAPGCQSDGDGGVTSTDSSSNTAYRTLCGTSMAAPTVSGLSALLLQEFRAFFPGEPDPRNSTLKILFAHNANDLGNIGPDYQYGYGSVRIQKTLDFMWTGNFLEDQVDQGDAFSVLVRVNSGDPELKVTLAWDDVPGTPNIEPALVNDLDLLVIAPNSQHYYPWTLDPYNPGSPALQTQANHIDNIEQVFVANPTAGVWRIEVYGYSVPQGPQPFSLSASPTLIACSSQGIIALDSHKYKCNATAGIQVIDCDLNKDYSTIETVVVTIVSGTEPGGESVELTETGIDTADFRGSIRLDTSSDNPGVLEILNGDPITATYIDADDGQGNTEITVSATATVDCTSPAIYLVQTTDIGPFNATATFNTDEPVNSKVRYGLDCGSLTYTATEGGYDTVHALDLTGLTENTTYFYAVDAVDEAGNTSTEDNGGSCYSFPTQDIPDYFTELFSSDNDLDNLSLTFKPDGSYDFYSACAQSIADLPVDPIGGTTLSLSDDSYAKVTLSGGNVVSLYGTSYDAFYVGSNGYITFTAGDSDYTESLADHFDLPRISALFDDLNPSSIGTVSWKQFTDRVVVTWEDVPQYNGSDSNTFQVQLLFDGTIVISYLSIEAVDGMVGLSEGNGIPPNFYESDLSAMEACTCNRDSDCDDGMFCNGVETCIDGTCKDGPPIDCSDGISCTDDSCNETTDFCDNIPNNANCDDGVYCNGEETCDARSDCLAGTPVNCQPGAVCNEDSDQCEASLCSNDGVCDPGEDCNSCPEDCISGPIEDCTACFKGKCDGNCNPQKEGPDCPDCASSYSSSYCCGDGICEGTEGISNCAIDCASAPFCGDGICNGDENSSTCELDCGSPCGSRGAPCSSGSECCSNQCNTGRGTCK